MCMHSSCRCWTEIEVTLWQNLENVDKMMRQLIDTENELLVHEQTLSDIYQQVARGEAVVSSPSSSGMYA